VARQAEGTREGGESVGVVVDEEKMSFARHSGFDGFPANPFLRQGKLKFGLHKEE